MPKTVAIGLYAYELPHPGGSKFKAFYEKAVAALAALQLKPTYLSVGGKGYPGKFTKYEGKVRAKLLSGDFENIDTLTVAVNPAGSDAPSADTYAEISLSYSDASNRAVLYVVIDEPYLAFNDARFNEMLSSFASLIEWHSGMAFETLRHYAAMFHILSLDDGKLEPDEYKRLVTWHGSSTDERYKKIRDVYPINLVNEVQLSAPVKPGQNLREYIRVGSNGTLMEIRPGKLWQWRIPEGSLDQIRKECRQAGTTIVT